MKLEARGDLEAIGSDYLRIVMLCNVDSVKNPI